MLPIKVVCFFSKSNWHKMLYGWINSNASSILSILYLFLIEFNFCTIIAKNAQKKSNFLSNRQACVIEQQANFFRDERTLLPHLPISRTILANNNPSCSLPFYAFLLHARQ